MKHELYRFSCVSNNNFTCFSSSPSILRIFFAISPSRDILLTLSGTMQKQIHLPKFGS